MKYARLLMRLHDKENPLTEEEAQWVLKQAATSRLVEHLYVEHVNKVSKREAGDRATELAQFHVSLGDAAQESSVYEILQSLISIQTNAADEVLN